MQFLYNNQNYIWSLRDVVLAHYLNKVLCTPLLYIFIDFSEFRAWSNAWSKVGQEPTDDPTND